LYGDFAVLKVGPGAGSPEVQCAGLFDEFWKLPKTIAAPEPGVPVPNSR
jgi:hypothetical protein